MDYKKQPAFTIVELLVVIVVIAILAAITIVSSTGISSKAIASSLQSDLNNASKQLNLYYAEYGSYPTAPLGNNICPTAPTADTKYCLKFSPNNSFFYMSNSLNFTLATNNGTTAYRITNNSSPINLADLGLSCPTGFIPVPGSATYGTSDFCVMKYEARNAGSNVPVSTAAGTPWISITQTNAIAYSSNVVGCPSCHLITEAEWMTLAQNVLSVPSNWSTGIVGSGYIYSGHNDNAPGSALIADVSDANGYIGTGQSSPSNQKRTLTLSNGEVIWDLAGNVWEWTNQQITGGQPNGMSVWGYYDWTVVSGGTLAINPYPSGTGISGSNTWNSTKGIGKLYGYTGDTLLHGFMRGGDCWPGGYVGLLAMELNYAPSGTAPTIGFRVSR